MPIKGVEAISGSSVPKIGEATVYSVMQWYQETPMEERIGEKVHWELFRKRSNGQFTTTNVVKQGLTAQFIFKDGSFRREYRLAAYLYRPEISGRSWISILPQKGKPIFEKLSFLGNDKKPFVETPKYGQTVFAKIETCNMQADELIIQIFSQPHQPGKINTLLYEKSIQVPTDGTPIHTPIPLIKLKANKALSGNVTHFSAGDEYYITIFHHRKKNGIEQILPVKQATLQVRGFGHDLTIKEGNAPVVVKMKEEKEQELDDKENKCPRCKLISLDEIKRIFKDVQDLVKLENIYTVFQKTLLAFEINTCLKKAHFFAQVLAEVGTTWSEVTGESLNYSTRRLIHGEFSNGKKWIKGDRNKMIGGYYDSDGGENFHSSPFNKKRIPDSVAEKYGRKDLFKRLDAGVQPANQKMLAIWAYAEKADRDNTGIPINENGWKFKGRGILQITWKENYEKAQMIINQKYPSIDIIANTDYFYYDKKNANWREQEKRADEYAIVAGCADWANKNNKQGISKVAQHGATPQDVDNVTAIINLKTDADSYQRRRNFFDITKHVFKVDSCEFPKK